MVKLMVVYGPSKDLAAFDKYYREIHISPVKRKLI